MLKRVNLVYGRSGTGKTYLLGKRAKYLYETTGLKAWWLLGDGGGETLDAMGLIPDVVEVYQYTIHKHPWETLTMLMAGMKPKDEEDPESPWERLDRSRFGMTASEGLMVACDYAMGLQEGGLCEQSARMGGVAYVGDDDEGGGKKGGNPLKSPFKLIDGSVTIGGVSQTGYGTTQRFALNLIEMSRGLPGEVWWSTHQRDVEEKKEERAIVVGPAVAGSALTTVIGRSFGHTLHLDTVSKMQQVKDGGVMIQQLDIERRMYWKDHFDPDGRNLFKYYANGRAEPEAMPPEVRRLWDKGWMSPPDLQAFLAMVEAGRVKRDVKSKTD